MVPDRIVERLTNQLCGVMVCCGTVQSEGVSHPQHYLQLMTSPLEGMSTEDHATQLRHNECTRPFE